MTSTTAFIIADMAKVSVGLYIVGHLANIGKALWRICKLLERGNP